MGKGFGRFAVRNIGASAATMTADIAYYPYISNLVPSHVRAGGPAFTLTVNGKWFCPKSVVQCNGSARTTKYVSATQLTAQITAADMAKAVAVYIMVVNPTGLDSNGLPIVMPTYPLIGAIIMMSAGFQGLGMTWIAMVMHVLRNIILKLPLAFWFAALWGVSGIWWSFLASALASAGLAVGWMWVVLRNLGSRGVEALQSEGEIATLAAQESGQEA